MYIYHSNYIMLIVACAKTCLQVPRVQIQVSPDVKSQLFSLPGVSAASSALHLEHATWLKLSSFIDADVDVPSLQMYCFEACLRTFSIANQQKLPAQSKILAGLPPSRLTAMAFFTQVTTLVRQQPHAQRSVVL